MVSVMTLVRCIGCGMILGKDPLPPAARLHPLTCPEHPLHRDLEELRAALTKLVALTPEWGRANHTAYTSHAMLCAVELDKDQPCDCGLADFLAARATADELLQRIGLPVPA